MPEMFKVAGRHDDVETVGFSGSMLNARAVTRVSPAHRMGEVHALVRRVAIFVKKLNHCIMATSPTLLFIIGPQAVGKMTVGQELSRATGYKFMSNHQTIELLLPIFDYGTPSFRRLLFDFRMSIFEEFATGERPGLLFSCVSDFDSALDRAQTECYAAPFLRRGGRVLFAELEASFETRLERNRTPNRQEHKPSKRDVAFAEKLLREEEKFRTDSGSVFPYAYPHLKINNEALSPPQVVAEICAYFGLKGGEARP